LEINYAGLDGLGFQGYGRSGVVPVGTISRIRSA